MLKKTLETATNVQDGGRLDKPPAADLFPIWIFPKENHLEDPDVSGGTPPEPSWPPMVTSGSEAQGKTPGDEFQEQLANMDKEEEPKIPETTEPTCPEQTQGELVEAGGKVERDQVGKAVVKDGEMTSQPTAPSKIAY